MKKTTTNLSLQTRKALSMAAMTLRTPVPAVFVEQRKKPEQASSLSHEERIAKLEAEIAALKQRAEVPALPSTGTAAVIEQLARERVERELAALVTGQAQVPSPARKRWWQWW
jgi:hypothetical protein